MNDSLPAVIACRHRSRSTAFHVIAFCLRLVPCLAWSLLTPPSQGDEQVIWRETFEHGADLWDPDHGVWAIGEPANPAGPQAIEGSRCASVGLRGDYPVGADSSLIRQQFFTVPPAAQNPRVRFSQWFSIWDGDYGEVRVRPEGGQPEAISEKIFWNSDWSGASYPLAKYAGKKVRLEFYFKSAAGRQAPGWFIDDVALVVGQQAFAGYENFEAGNLWSFNDWCATRGNWQVGVPLTGPGKAYQGTNTAAVNLTGHYTVLARSSLVGPPFVVPAADQKPRLDFFQWFSIWDGDFGQVRVRDDAGNVTAVSEKFFWNSPWSKASVSLDKFAGKKVQIDLYFESPSGRQAEGWFVDNLKLSTGDFQLRGKETFENGWGDWFATRGNWQIGSPVVGPGKAYAGTNCAALTLDGNYTVSANSSLISPWVRVPRADQDPRLRLQHWFSIWDGDFGQVQIRDENGTSEALSDKFAGNSDWSRASFSLAKYAGRAVQIEFNFQSPSGRQAAGWFIDEVEILPTASSGPQLQAIPTQVGSAEALVRFTASATNALPGQSLTYSLDSSSAPENASIDSKSGVFTWQPSPTQVEANAHYVRVRVSDDSVPPRTDSQLVPIAMQKGVRLSLSHSWEPRMIKAAGAVPGVLYTNYVFSTLIGDTVWPQSLSNATPLGEFQFNNRGESFIANVPTSLDPQFFVIRGEPVGLK